LAEQNKRQSPIFRNKYYNNCVNNPFYQTLQIARLIKEITLELRTGASITALLGDPCTGKTRILYEIGKKQRKIGKKQKHKPSVRWIELGSRDSGDSAKQDRGELVEAAFNSANDGDIIVVDHFESAFNKTRHQLFLSWSTVGIQKKLKLVIACYSEVSDELEEIALEYYVRIKSYQLMPFNNEQVEAFLGFYLFPDHPDAKISIPGDLRVQFAVAQGKVGLLIEIAERERDRIEIDSPKNTRLTHLGGGMVTALAGFALVMVVSWFFLSGDDDTVAAIPIASSDSSKLVASLGSVTEVWTETEPEVSEIERAVIEPSPEASTDLGQVEITQMTPAAGVMTEPEVEAVDETPGEQIPANEIGSIQLSASESAFETEAKFASVAEPDSVPANDNLIDAQEQTPITQEMAAVTSVDTVEEEGVGMAEPASSDSSIDEWNQSVEQRLERDLKASMDWIYNNENSFGTIQILLLSSEKFDAKGYYEHVDYLASQQVDISILRIFKTYTGNREAYSVFYGVYDSRGAAGKAKDSLPEVLRKTSPIPRSVGGIMQEIRRLEAMN